MQTNRRFNSLYVVKSSKEICMWEKYRRESKQTICIIGVLTLAAKLCKADGHFSIVEEEEILKIIPHERDQKRILLKILDEAAADPHSIQYHAKRIYKLIGDDEVAWTSMGIRMIETGCYAKSEGLTPDTHRTIFDAVATAKKRNIA